MRFKCRLKKQVFAGALYTINVYVVVAALTEMTIQEKKL